MCDGGVLMDIRFLPVCILQVLAEAAPEKPISFGFPVAKPALSPLPVAPAAPALFSLQVSTRAPSVHVFELCNVS